MQLSSAAFRDNQPIPTLYTGEGEDVSPPLAWHQVPEKCKSLALVCEDPDAPSARGRDYPFVHWLIYNIPPHLRGLPERIPKSEMPNFEMGITQGMNSFGRIGYGGPLPPEGSGTHRYTFCLYALRRNLELDPGLTKRELIDQLRGEVLEITKLTGLYTRRALRRAG